MQDRTLYARLLEIEDLWGMTNVTEDLWGMTNVTLMIECPRYQIAGTRRQRVVAL